jgi:hypothetical protein
MTVLIYPSLMFIVFLSPAFYAGRKTDCLPYQESLAEAFALISARRRGISVLVGNNKAHYLLLRGTKGPKRRTKHNIIQHLSTARPPSSGSGRDVITLGRSLPQGPIHIMLERETSACMFKSTSSPETMKFKRYRGSETRNVFSSDRTPSIAALCHGAISYSEISET